MIALMFEDFICTMVFMFEHFDVHGGIMFEYFNMYGGFYVLVTLMCMVAFMFWTLCRMLELFAHSNFDLK